MDLMSLISKCSLCIFTRQFQNIHVKRIDKNSLTPSNIHCSYSLQLLAMKGAHGLLCMKASHITWVLGQASAQLMDAHFQHASPRKRTLHKDLLVSFPHPTPPSCQGMGLSEWISKCQRAANYNLANIQKIKFKKPLNPFRTQRMRCSLCFLVQLAKMKQCGHTKETENCPCPRVHHGTKLVS